MYKIPCSATKNIGEESTKKYFDSNEMRMTLCENYVNEDGWHKHNMAHQIIFIISGSLKIRKGKGYEIVKENEFIIIPAEEWHEVIPKTPTNMLVIKYKSHNSNFIKQLIEDYVHMEKK